MMRNLLNKRACRYLIVHDDGAILLQTHNGEFTSVDLLQMREPDLKFLADTINLEPDIPFTLVIDCFDEDFRLHNVTHVRGPDRHAVLERKSHALFRSAPYRFSRVVGREESGRRDDRAVFSAISVAEKVDCWVDVILNNHGQIIAITSVAYLAELWRDLLEANSGVSESANMLVSFDGYSGLRTTFIKNGSTLVSRLVKRTVSSEEQLLQMVKDQTLQTRKYLESIKLLGGDEELHCTFVHTLERLESYSEPLSQLTHLHTLYQSNEFLPEQGEVPTFHSSFVPGSILRFRLDSSKVNKYARLEKTRYFWLRRVRRVVHACSLAIFSLATVLSLPSGVLAFQAYRSAQTTEEEILPLQIEYESLTRRFPETPISSSIMQMLVELHNQVSQVTDKGLELVIRFSQVLAQRPDLDLQEITWILTEDNASFDPSSDAEANVPESVVLAVLDRQYRYMLTINAQVDNASNLLGVNEQVTTFLQDLEADGGMQVGLRELPVDVEPSATVSLELDGSNADSGFSFNAWEDTNQDRQVLTRP